MRAISRIAHRRRALNAPAKSPPKRRALSFHCGASGSIVVAIPTASPAAVTVLITSAIVAIALSITTISPVVIVAIASIVPVGAIVVRLPPAASPLIADQADLFDA
jgi:hypothetical protein